jgi:two-component system, chemotaxis family, response regulator Rcp1
MSLHRGHVIDLLRKPGHKYVLLADDNDADARIVEEAVAASNASIVMHTVENAVLAFSYLSKQGPFTEAPTPDLVLLDLAMPVLDGRKVLSIAKNEPAWRQIPVIVLTSSSNPKDADECYALGADLYVVKPTLFDGWMRVVRAIAGYLEHRTAIATTSAVMHVLQRRQPAGATVRVKGRRQTHPA